MSIYTKLGLSAPLLSALEKRFIAFDTETTGLDKEFDRIIEVGAVLFEDGKPVREYGSLIHSVNYVPYEARMVNHISDQMVRSAPEPEKVYPELITFLGDALKGNTVLVGHNAAFDMGFLSKELSRMGIGINVAYADTCSLSRIALPNLYSHKQDMVAQAFGIKNKQSHRAVTDAEVCGQIMVSLIPLLRKTEKVEKEMEKRREKQEKYEPCEEEKIVCRILSTEVSEPLYFQKAGKLVHVRTAKQYYQKGEEYVHVRTEKSLLSLCLTGKQPYVVTSKVYVENLLQRESFAGVTIHEGSATEEKLYKNAVRVFTEGEIAGIASAILQQMLTDREAVHIHAQEQWKIQRELQLCWCPR